MSPQLPESRPAHSIQLLRVISSSSSISLLLGGQVVGEEVVELGEGEVVVEELQLAMVVGEGAEAQGFEAVGCFMSEVEPVVEGDLLVI